MNKTNLNQIPQTSKTRMETIIKNYYLKPKGLLISFTHKGKWNSIQLNPTQTLTLLEDRDYIYHFLPDKTITVYTKTSWANPDASGEPVEDEQLQEETWEDFVDRFSFELNDRIALELVKRFIQLQEIKQWEDEMKERMLEIPTLVRHMIPNAS